MTYQQHRNHVLDGDAPWPECPYCEAFILAPCRREVANEWRDTGTRVLLDELREHDADK
jgi:hypothetical protein